MVETPVNHTFSERANFPAHFGPNISGINQILTFLDTVLVLLPSEFENPGWPWPRPGNRCKSRLNINKKSFSCEQ